MDAESGDPGPPGRGPECGAGGSGRSQDRYTARQIARLTRVLRREIRQRPVGRCLCPYCKHLEARWRAAADPEDAALVVVRVRCSQCQLQAIIRLDRG